MSSHGEQLISLCLFIYVKSTLGHLLGVDRGVGIVESSDDIVSKPGACYDGAKS